MAFSLKERIYSRFERMSSRSRRILQIATRTILSTLLALVLSLILAEPFSMSTSSIFASPEKNDFQMTDMFAQIADSRPVRTLEDRMVIVNIGLADRQQIGEALQLISLCQPKVVGVDINFRDSTRADIDSTLLEGLRVNPGVVLPLVVDKAEDNRFVIKDTPFFYDATRLSEDAGINYGVVNLPAKSHKATIREYAIDFDTEDGKIPSFVARLAELYDKTSTDRLRKRGEKLGITSYHSREYNIIDLDEIEQNPELLTDRIVLLGALDDASDMHATPINSYMPGIIIHAHALSTILDGVWYRHTPPAFDYLIAIFICLIITALSFTLHVKFKGLTLRLLQVLLIILAVRIGYGVFIDSNIIFNFTYTFLIIAFGLFAVDIYNGLEEAGRIILKRIKSKSNINQEI